MSPEPESSDFPPRDGEAEQGDTVATNKSDGTIVIGTIAAVDTHNADVHFLIVPHDSAPAVVANRFTVDLIFHPRLPPSE